MFYDLNTPHINLPKVVKFKCQYCDKEAELYRSRFIKRKRLNCANCTTLARSHPGNQNGMFGKTHTDEVKQAQSVRAKLQKTNISYEQLMGKEAADELKEKRRIKFLENKVWQTRGKIEYTPELRNKIGKKSSSKFTSELKSHYRKLNEEAGRWIPLHHKSDYEIYKIESDWKVKMWDIVPCDNLNKVGIFNSKTNKKGYVRDHIYSRYDGLINRVPPILLRHPANCQIILVTENSIKRSKSHITLEELFKRVYDYPREWHEQPNAIQAIQDYKQGINLWFNQFKEEMSEV